MQYVLFIFFVSSLSFYYFNFKILKFFLGIDFKESKTKNLDQSKKLLLAKLIHTKYKKVSESYIMECFSRYPKIVIAYRRKNIKGFYFFSQFEEGKYFYCYLGPTFFLDKTCLAMTYYNSFLQSIKEKEQVFFMAELQNPELIMHIHYVFPEAVFPQAKTFYISKRAKDALLKFSKKITQLDKLDIDSFKSKSNCSLYYNSLKKHIVSEWLEKNNVYLDQEESLVLIFDLNNQALKKFKKQAIYGLLTYPSHKEKYLKDLKEFLDNA